jgi:hypothetical protein
MRVDNVQTVYPTKRDTRLVAVLWGAVVVLLGAFLFLWSTSEPLASRMVMTILFGTVAALILWITYGTQYILTARELLIRSGPFRWRISLQEITEVFPTSNPLSGPACSLDRLCVRYGAARRSILISPQDKEAFLGELIVREPGLLREAEKVFRAS